MSTRLADGPGSREPGLDQLIKALTADGHPSELAGKGAALAAFRAASAQPRRKAGFRPCLALPRGSVPWPPP